MSVIAKPALIDLTVCEMAAAIASTWLSPVQAVEAALARIAEREPVLQAWAHVDFDGARGTARVMEAEARAGKLRGPLHGVPVGVKDVFHVAGMPTIANSRTTDPDARYPDSPVVAALRRAGAIILGKCATVEFAGAGVVPQTRNPWNTDHTPGGSSSGSGAAVSARMVPMALGTQTGGSTLRPAAYCGVAAFKPSPRHRRKGARRRRARPALARRRHPSVLPRMCGRLEGGVLAVQGPPGAGKTFTGAHMICELVARGRTVGITANSHKVIRNLIDGTIRRADERGVPLQCCHKADEAEAPKQRLSFARSNGALFAALADGAASVGGGTAWLWSRPEAFETLDVLFVDEAAQMSLANVLAVSQAAKTVVLIGDPQQLDQPTQGSHPEGTDVSALDHILDAACTVGADRGLFLEETWRLHPVICAYTSELFYDGKLRSRDGLQFQHVKGAGPVDGSGLWFLPVAHTGNQNASPEEAQAVAGLVPAILKGRPVFVDPQGRQRAVTLDDIVIVTPYNAQVFEIEQRLPGARVGTVDKFQGQEAPIAIYSMATSSHADAPRGMEFLYSLNRLNVATSRARCVSILVASPKITQAECRNPRHLQLADAFCRYLEMARTISLP